MHNTQNPTQTPSQTPQLRIGPFIFAKTPPKHLKQQLQHLYRNYMKAKTGPTFLKLQNGRKAELIPQEAIYLAISYSIPTLTQLSLQNNKMTQTIFLSKCVFQNLSILNLSRNKLQNLAELYKYLQFPLLQELILSNNQFTSLKGIKKWYLPQLNRLALELNFINDIGDLFEARLPGLTHLEIYANNVADFRPLFRVDLTHLTYLQLYQNLYNHDYCTTYPILLSKFKSLQKNSLRP